MANATVTTYPGRSIQNARQKGLGTEAKYGGWGTGTPTASAKSDVNLFAPAAEARATAVTSLQTSSFLADEYLEVYSITATAGKTVTETGIFDSPTAAQTLSLAASITASQTTMTLSGTLLPSSGGNYYAQINNECILVTGAASSINTIARGQLGSASAIQANASLVTPGGDGGAFANNSLGGATATWAASLGGSMFFHADFAGDALNTNDSITFSASVTLT